MARVLHGRGYPAIAIGQASGGDAIIPLADWASRIVIMQPYFMGYSPVEHRAKVVLNDVGHDVWSNPYNSDLLKICSQFANKMGWVGPSHES